jgi:hypothetical protein
MPIVQLAEQYEKIVLPSYASLPEDQQAWVQMNVAPMSGADFLTIDSNDTDGETQAKALIRRIIEWNLQDPQGKILPIVIENLKFVDFHDLVFLKDQVKTAPVRLEDSEKKALSITSSESETVKLRTD